MSSDAPLVAGGPLPLPEPSKREDPGGRAEHRPNPLWNQYRRIWYFFRQNRLALIGTAILIFFVFAFVYGVLSPANPTALQIYCGTNGAPSLGSCGTGVPTICTYPENTISPGPGCYPTPVVNGVGYANLIAPTLSVDPPRLGPLPFGSFVASGQFGQPYFYNLFDGMVKGSVWSLSISVLIVGVGALAGLLLGTVAGYYGSLVDEVLMRVTDIFLSIPGILLVIVVILAGVELGLSSFTDRIYLMVGAFAVQWWPTYARITRGQVLVIREQKYVEAARASGATDGRILRRHILPNSLYPVFVQLSLDVGSVPLAIAAIVFIGFPIVPNPLWPEWGSLAAEGTVSFPALLQECAILGSGYCPVPWWQALFPGAALFFFAISVNFVADGLRDALDPRLRR